MEGSDRHVVFGKAYGGFSLHTGTLSARHLTWCDTPRLVMMWS
jgi:hypothetical protein